MGRIGPVTLEGDCHVRRGGENGTSVRLTIVGENGVKAKPGVLEKRSQ